ncbi:MAG: CRTAC1 family protein [Acidobacteriota bacterium]
MLIAGLLLAFAGQAARPVFTDVTAAAGLETVHLVSGGPSKDFIVETLGTGVAAFDYDGDGWQDLYFANGSRLGGYPAGKDPLPWLFRNRGDGTFEDVTARAGLGRPFWGFGVAVGDFDNDGWTDLFVTAYGANKLYRNSGDGTFRDVSAAAGVNDRRWGASAAFADFDADGLLDLYVANYVAFDPARVPRRGDKDRPCFYRGEMVMCGPTGLDGVVDILYRNRGDGTFEDVTARSGIRTDIGLFGLGVAAADYDEDGDVDIYVANDATPNQLYRNRGDGTFDEVGAMSGVAYGTDGAEQGSMGTSFGDVDGDGRLDLVVSNFSHQFYQVFRNAGDGFFEDVTYEVGLAQRTYLVLGWATQFFDYDNDGYLDLFFANGHVYSGVDRMQIGSTYKEKNLLLHNTASGGRRVFVDESAVAGSGFNIANSHRAGGAWDFDRDGDEDLILTIIDGKPLLLRNNAGSAQAWIALRPVGTTSNRSGIGTRFILTAGDRRLVRYASGGGSFQWACDPKLTVGLGRARLVDTLEVVWPSGRRQTFRDLPAGAEYTLVEGEDPRRVGE